jgi:Tfp pilus assembly ATPase PilU
MTRGEVSINFLLSWKAAGIPAKEVLKIMTINGYKVCGIEKERGPIKEGMAADMIAVPGNPLDDIDALRNVVRQDPNVILLGEMRDQETVAASITAAQTGHLVLSTIHTVDAAQCINRIVDLFPPHQHTPIRYLLADTLKAVISQRLLPHASGKGRVPAVEVLIVTPMIKKLIEDNNLSEVTNMMKQGQYYGMQTFNQSLIKLYKSGEIKLEDALAAASNPEELMLAIRGVQSSTDDASNFIER